MKGERKHLVEQFEIAQSIKKEKLRALKESVLQKAKHIRQAKLRHKSHLQKRIAAHKIRLELAKQNREWHDTKKIIYENKEQHPPEYYYWQGETRTNISPSQANSMMKKRQAIIVPLTGAF